METWQEISENEQRLEESLRTLKSNWVQFAQADRDYRIAKAHAILELKSKGYPATLIPDIVKGYGNVPDLSFKRMIAEATYKSNIEAINVFKQKANDLRMYFESEWRNTK